MNLPIDIILGSRPPRFRWKQAVSNPFGTFPTIIDHEGTLPPTVEEAVAQLIALAKTQARRLDGALTQIAEMAELRQQELERTTEAPTTSAPEPVSSSKKGGGTRK